MNLALLAQLTHYEVLGVGHDASTAEIEAAYQQRVSELPSSEWKRLLLRLYTGRNAQSLAAARDTLVHASERTAYDTSLRYMRFWMPML